MNFFEFKRKVASLGYGIRPDAHLNYELCTDIPAINNTDLQIFSFKSDEGIYSISNECVGYFRPLDICLAISDYDRLKLQKLAYKFSRTPIDKRFLYPKFRVRMIPAGEVEFLNFDKESGHIIVSFNNDVLGFQNIFTKPEYEKIQQIYPQWLPEFDENDPHFEFLGEN